MKIERIYCERQLNGYLLCVESYKDQPTHSESYYETEKKLYEFSSYKNRKECRAAMYVDLNKAYDIKLNYEDEKMDAKPKGNPIDY